MTWGRARCALHRLSGRCHRTASPLPATAARLAVALRKAIGGSFGPFYAKALLRAARAVGGHGTLSAREWATAFDEAVTAICELGDRTMVDTLRPGSDAFIFAAEAGQSLEQSWAEAIKAAEVGHEATKAMCAGAGRAAYLGDRAVGILDGGAAAVVWMKALKAL